MDLIKKGTLSISPLQDDQIQPASVDIRLGNTFSVVEDSSAGILNFTDNIAYKEIHAETYLLLPGQFVLADGSSRFEALLRQISGPTGGYRFQSIFG